MSKWDDVSGDPIENIRAMADKIQKDASRPYRELEVPVSLGAMEGMLGIRIWPNTPDELIERAFAKKKLGKFRIIHFNRKSGYFTIATGVFV